MSTKSTAAFRYEYKHTISDGNLSVEVTVVGLALLAEESDGTWEFLGVTPGGISAHAKTPQKAIDDFYDAYKGILLDIANESASAEVFKAEMSKFMAETDTEELKRWELARERLAQEQAKKDGVPTPTPPKQDYLLSVENLEDSFAELPGHVPNQMFSTSSVTAAHLPLVGKRS